MVLGEKHGTNYLPYTNALRSGSIFLLRAIKKSSCIDIYFNINPRGYIALLEFTQN